MTVNEILLTVLWRCSDFCNSDCLYIPCIHDIGYKMYVLGCKMLETGDNPLI